MWYAGQGNVGPSQRGALPHSQSAGNLRPSSGTRRRRAAAAHQTTALPPCGSRRQEREQQLPPRAARRPRDSASPPWQLPNVSRGLQELGKAGPAIALDTAESAEELMCVGVWSVRKHPGTGGLVYVNVETNCVQAEPPAEVLSELDMEDEGLSSHDGAAAEDLPSRQGTPCLAGSCVSSSSEQARCEEPSPEEEEELVDTRLFRRILLSSERGMPLAMARDIVAALREDASIFEAAREKFSDVPAEPSLEMCGLPEELGGVAESLGPGEFSGVIGTDAGIQILLRVS